MKRFLEAGRLCSPRGVKGELRFECWCDGPEFLEGVKHLYLDRNGEKPLKVKLYRPSIPSIVFEGYEDKNSASALTSRTVWFDREELELEEGVLFNDDLIGVPVFDDETNEKIGFITEVIDGARHYIYNVSDGVEGGRRYSIPVVDEFVKSVSVEGVRVSLIEGL